MGIVELKAYLKSLPQKRRDAILLEVVERLIEIDEITYWNEDEQGLHWSSCGEEIGVNNDSNHRE